ncbi:MAG: GNAT family N-acetyltransferase [Kiritimatiellia bacterium]
MYEVVKTWETVLALLARKRNEGCLRYANFFPDERRMTRWIEQGEFFVQEEAEGALLLRRQKTFDLIWFLAPSEAAMVRLLTLLPRERTSVIEMVGRRSFCDELANLAAPFGWKRSRTLVRMSRLTPVEQYVCNESVKPARLDEAVAIQTLLERYFDPKKEQLPSLYEITEWILAEHLLVVHTATGAVGAFVIFDLLQSVLYLRYWFVLPEARGQGVGALLLRAFFARGAQTKRQILWVFEDNATAIGPQRHYGFKEEDMIDHVLINPMGGGSLV